MVNSNALETTNAIGMKPMMRALPVMIVIASAASSPAFAHGGVDPGPVLLLLFGIFVGTPSVATLMAFVSWRLGATLRFAFIFGLITLGLLSLFLSATFLGGLLSMSAFLTQCVVYVVLACVLRSFPYFRRRNESHAPHTKPNRSL